MARSVAKSASPLAVTFSGDERVVVLYGKEGMLQRLAMERLRGAVARRHGEAEPIVLDGVTATLAEVLDELRSYSLMTSYKLVVVEGADGWLKLHRGAVERYVEEPVDHATLVLRSEAWNRGKLDKLVEKVGVMLKCEPVAAREAAAWLMERAASEHDTRLSKAAAEALVARAGVSLMTLDSEVAKLALMSETGEVSVELIEATLGQTSEERAWAIQEALLESMSSKSAGPALTKLHELLELAGNDAVPVSWAAADLMRKLSQAITLKRAGVETDAIFKQLRIWGPQQRTVLGVLRGMRAEVPAKLLHHALSLDQRSRTGLGEATGNLERFCVDLVEEVRG